MKRFGEIVGFLSLLLQMVIAGAFLCPVLFVAGAGNWQWYHWLLLIPILYVAWLLVFLSLSAWTCASVGSVIPSLGFRELTSDLRNPGGMLTVRVCSRHGMIVDSLPLIRYLGMVGGGS